jgi:adenosylcobinamide-GDP ribazoletransferase
MLRPLLCAIGFLTRIPIPQRTWSEEDVARAAGFFAWVGGLVALVLFGAAQLHGPLGARSTSYVLVAVWALVTGGLHLDGLADTVDGFSGGRGQPERTLEIMRDSRIGSHGALALVLLVVLKASALESLLTQGRHSWLLAPVLARFLCTLLMVAFPYARAQGLGRVFAGRLGLRELLIGALALLPALVWAGPTCAGGALGATLVSLGLALQFKRRLSGLTGDGYGAAIELSETACLLLLSLR